MPTKLRDKLYNKSATNPQQFDNPQQVYIKSTTIQQIELMEVVVFYYCLFSARCHKGKIQLDVNSSTSTN